MRADWNVASLESTKAKNCKLIDADTLAKTDNAPTRRGLVVVERANAKTTSAPSAISQGAISGPAASVFVCPATAKTNPVSTAANANSAKKESRKITRNALQCEIPGGGG